MLERLGLRADVAGNGQEALEMLALLPYDVIFMDCQMPDTDGYEAAAAIRCREGPNIHPRAGSSGWSSRTILNYPIRRAARDA